MIRWQRHYPKQVKDKNKSQAASYSGKKDKSANYSTSAPPADKKLVLVVDLA